MRASWNDIYGRKIVIANIQEIRAMDIDKMEFKANLDSIPMKVYIDDNEFIECYRLYETSGFIDSKMELSADKE